MKKKTILAIVLLIAIIGVLFPIPTTHTVSGEGAVLNPQKEKIGDCELEVELIIYYQHGLLISHYG